MTTRLWLKTSDKLPVEKSKDGRYDILENFFVFSENGLRFVALNGDIMEPSTPLPRFPAKYISTVTYRGRIYSPLIRVGFYTYKGATARIETVFETEGRAWQEISMRGGSVRTLRDLYQRIRMEQIKPIKLGVPEPRLADHDQPTGSVSH